MTTTIAESALDLDNPRPGIYPGISFSDYSKIRAMNCSTLAWIDDSEAHLLAAIEGRLKSEDTPAKGFGRCLHIRILEPDTYSERVKIKANCRDIITSKKSKNYGEPCGKPGQGMVVGEDGERWCCGTHGGDSDALDPAYEYLSQDEAERIEHAVNALRNRKIDNVRKAKGMYEVAMVAVIAGVLVKVRLDKYIATPSTIVDVKKVAAPKSPGTAIAADEFTKRIQSMRYGSTAALYCDVVKELTGITPRWYWLTIEDGEPYTPAIYRASDTCLAAGRNEYMSMLQRYKLALEKNIWPGPADEPKLLDGPGFWLTRNGVEG